MEGRGDRNSNLTRDQVFRIILLIVDGYMANLVDVNQLRVVARYRKAGLYERCAVLGRPRATTSAVDRFLTLQD